MAKKNIEDVDLYAILDLQITATEAEIKKAYRKKALQCHPDKNPDDPKAAETFHGLSRALEILTDTSARAAYDKVLRAKATKKNASEPSLVCDRDYVCDYEYVTESVVLMEMMQAALTELLIDEMMKGEQDWSFSEPSFY